MTRLRIMHRMFPFTRTCFALAGECMMISPSIYSVCREAGVPVVQTLHNFRLLCPGANFFRDGAVCEECLQHGVWRAVQYGCYRDSAMAG